MIPILFESQTKDFSSNGIGRLSDCISCTVTEERNGKYELVLKYPLNGIHYNEISDDRIIYVTHDNSGDKQPFIIYAKSAPLNGIVTFYAHHVSYYLTDVIVRPFTASSLSGTFNKFKTQALTDNPFTFWTDKSSTTKFKVVVPSSIRSILGGVEGSVLDTYGGEFEFDKYTVKLHNNRGEDRGVTVRYGKNLTSLLHTYSTLDAYNTIVPYWNDTSGHVVYGNPVVAIGSGTRQYTNPWTQENDTSITDENGNVFEFTYYLNHSVTMSFIDKFVDKPTKQQLQAAAASVLQSRTPWVPDDNIQFNFVDLFGAGEMWSDESEYLKDENGNFILDDEGGKISLIQNFVKEDLVSLTTVRLCDTVKVVYTALGVSATAKVIKTVWNPLLDKYDSLEIGKARTTLSEAINKGTRVMLQDYPTNTEMEDAIDNATTLITGGMGGHVVFSYDAEGKPTEIFIMDTEDVGTAMNVLRMNVNGIGFSHSGIGGPFETAWTLDGNFVADFITTGTLSANLVRSGMLASTDGTSYWDLDGSEIRFYDRTFNSYVRLDEGFVEFSHDNRVFGKIVRMLLGDEDVLTIQGSDYTKRILISDDMINATIGSGKSVSLTDNTINLKLGDKYIKIDDENNNIDLHVDGDNYVKISKQYGYIMAKSGDRYIKIDNTNKYIDVHGGDAKWMRFNDVSGDKYVWINADSNNYILLDDTNNRISIYSTKLYSNGYEGYNGTVTAGNKTLTFTNGICTGVANA